MSGRPGARSGLRCRRHRAGGLATAWRGPRWPVMSARFERPWSGNARGHTRPCRGRIARRRFRDDVGVAQPGPRPDRTSHQPSDLTHRRRWPHPSLRRCYWPSMSPRWPRCRLVTCAATGCGCSWSRTPGRLIAELTGGPDAVAVVDLTMPGLDPRASGGPCARRSSSWWPLAPPASRAGPAGYCRGPAVADPAVQPPPAGRPVREVLDAAGPRTAGRAGRTAQADPRRHGPRKHDSDRRKPGPWWAAQGRGRDGRRSR